MSNQNCGSGHSGACGCPTCGRVYGKKDTSMNKTIAADKKEGFTLPDANVVAERLCIEAEKLGLCHPTETMIANCLHDFEWNALMYPDAGWEHHGGNPNIKM